MKSSPKSYLLSLASAIAGAIIGALLVAVPLVLTASSNPDERIHYFLSMGIPFVIGFAIIYGLIDYLVRKNYLAIKRWTRAVLGMW